MWFEMQYHINQSLNVTVPIPAAFTQAEGNAAVMSVWLGVCMCMHFPITGQEGTSGRVEQFCPTKPKHGYLVKN